MFILKQRDTAVNSLAFSPDGSALAAAGYWGYLHLWDLGSRTLRREERLATNNISSVFFAPEARLAAFNGFLHQFDAGTGEWIELHSIGRCPTPVVFAPAPWPSDRVCTARLGKKSFSCYSFPGNEQLWQAALPDEAYRAVRQKRSFFTPALVSSLAFSGDGTTVAAGCVTGEVFVRRASDGKPVAAIREPGRPAVGAVALSPDTTRLAVCAASHLRLYRLAPAPEEVAHVSLGRTHFLAVTWHPSGRFFATVNGDGSADFWDAATGERRESFDWGVGKLQEIVFDARGDRAACGARNGQVVVWDVDE
jgi:WD40 repeat protein